MSKAMGTEALFEASAKISDLTDRQIDVVRCLATGSTNRQIATRLGISEFTVKVHVGNALEALGLESRLQTSSGPPAPWTRSAAPDYFQPAHSPNTW